jgi:crotonobetainyl-CoA:carnitine CoA-transferase CaiB-like acyl-CoA transferase
LSSIAATDNLFVDQPNLFGVKKMSRALEGIRVVDLSHVLAAPITTMFLADLGAEVIHVEPPQGDDAREFGPFVGDAGKNRSGYFISLNRNKKSMVIDLRKEAGIKVLRQLIEVSDVLIENYRDEKTRIQLGRDPRDQPPHRLCLHLRFRPIFSSRI